MEKKRYRLIYVRTIAVFLAVWLLMVGILTVRNREQNLTLMEQWLDDDAALIAHNVNAVLEGTAADGRKPAILANQLYSASGFEGAYLTVYRVYDEYMNELGTTPITYGSISPPGTYTHSQYILFDAVLTDAEQITLAERLRADNYKLNTFYGSDYAHWGEMANMGLYGEVTGIFDEDSNTIIPQKLVYYYEDHETVVMESDHTMFDGAELTTLSFGSAYIKSTLSWNDASPEQLLKLYRRAEEHLGMGSKEHVGINWSGTYRYNDWYGEFSALSGVGVARVCAFAPWQMTTHGLWFTYIATFAVVLLAAILAARGQVKTLKRERQFTRAVAHELKTPAAVLRSYAEALGEGVEPIRQREYCAVIVEEADRMAQLVGELLDLSRMEGGADLAQWESLALGELVREQFGRLSIPMQERGLCLEMELCPVSLMGNAKRLTQMCSNLAVNVLRHAAPGAVQVRLQQESGRAVLTVENRCDPIPPERLSRLWEPFYKLDGSRSGEGSGMGLAVVKNIVEFHGGACRAELTHGGIRFRIELPV